MADKKVVKSVKMRGTVYGVEVLDNKIIASRTIYPLSGYGNNYGTEYVIDLNYSKGWARLLVNCWNDGWACRGHGMTAYWTEGIGYARKSEAKKFVEKIKKELEEAEDGTPDIYRVFDIIRSFVEDKCFPEDEDY